MLKEYYKLLRCPDDCSEVLFRGKYLECTKCGRHFPIYAHNLVEMLPLKFPKWELSKGENKKAEQIYINFFKERFTWNKRGHGWGWLPTASPGYRSFVEKEKIYIFKLLNISSQDIAIDVSGGVGNYSIPLANKLKLLFHCEIEIQSILEAYNKGKEKNNIIFIRAPYLKLPFNSNLFDIVVCTDTLIRGKNHEKMLLAEIYRILKYKGKSIVDFHNLRFFDKEINNIAFYKVKEIKSLLLEIGICKYTIYSFGYVPSCFVIYEFLYPILDSIFKSFMPCIRHIVQIVKENKITDKF